MLHLPVVMCRVNFHSKENSTPITHTFITDGKSPKVYLGTVVPGIDSLSVQFLPFFICVNVVYHNLSPIKLIHTYHIDFSLGYCYLYFNR